MVDYPDLDVAEADWIDQDEFIPRYNIAPRSNAPVIRRQDPDQSELVIHTMKWGVVPHWSKHEDLTLNTINARAENLVDSGGMWGSMKSKKRCVVVCDGYFEWLKKGKERLPHFIRHKDNKLLILAGLYDSVILEGATTRMWTFTVVTTNASTSLAWLHDRQPVILASTVDLEKWLDTSQGWHKGLIEIMKPGDGKELECYPVPKEVGRVGTNSPDFIKPVSQRKGGLEALFAKQAAKGKRTSLTSPKKQVLSTAIGAPSTSQDGMDAKRAIVIDASPSPPLAPSSENRLPSFPTPVATQKRTMAEDPEGIPPKKRVKDAGLEHENAQKEGCADGALRKNQSASPESQAPSSAQTASLKFLAS